MKQKTKKIKLTMKGLTRKQKKRRIEIGANRGLESFDLLMDFIEFLGYTTIKIEDKWKFEKKQKGDLKNEK